ncbi:hypothetical protein E2L08_05105 [Palleronia sediminis]|uniref:Sulfotransferase family protein n=1 Tax=Palleronia sediminis TaxID=2547833 RepID=A0A4V3BA48_9RHOB|nr:hypothetical protein [Palleronia sediminis]TDL81499.1 hypothetical protein E2L08_05105 [Palleronia sediminis]
MDGASRSAIGAEDRSALLAPGPVRPGAHAVADRPAPGDRSFIEPGHLVPGDAAEPITGGSVYALDAFRGAAILCDIGYDRLAGRPFAYAVQSAEAQRIEMRPLDTLAPPAARQVIALFSIGRCGSTLLGQALTAAGAVVLSELDAFTALGPLSRRWPSDESVQDRLAAIATALTGHVARHAPEGPLVLKFRSQAMQAAPAICGTGLRPILLTRDFEGWAASNARHFPTDPLPGRIDALSHGLNAMARIGPALEMLTFRALLDDPVAAVETCLGAPVPAGRHAAIRACLDRHSQAGTDLETPRARAGDADIAAAARLWSDTADRDALARLGLGSDLVPTPPS